jgi:membrane protease YdiL (CAAX protease family)
MLTGDLENLPELLIDPTLQVYLPTIILQLIILFAVLLVAKLEGGGANSLGYGRFTLDKFVIGCAFFLGAWLVLSLLAVAVEFAGFAEFRDPTIFLPRTFSDKVIWTILAIVVAFAEETAFRGYALTRLEAITKNRVLTAIVVSLAFSAGHFYQGIGGLIVIFVYGLMFSVLFYKTGSLWPGIVAHFLQDFTPILFVDFLKRMQGG